MKFRTGMAECSPITLVSCSSIVTYGHSIVFSLRRDCCRTSSSRVAPSYLVAFPQSLGQAGTTRPCKGLGGWSRQLRLLPAPAVGRVKGSALLNDDRLLSQPVNGLSGASWSSEIPSAFLSSSPTTVSLEALLERTSEFLSCPASLLIWCLTTGSGHMFIGLACPHTPPPLFLQLSFHVSRHSFKQTF
jgi:hypothetical protein